MLVLVFAAVMSPGSHVFPDAARLTAGARHTCVLGEDGAVQCWGSNREGQLGDGTTTDRSRAAPVTGLGDAVEVVAGSDHTCARRRGGEVVCWGSAEFGEVGDGTTGEGGERGRDRRRREGKAAMRTTPVAVALPGPAEALYAGRAVTCARVAGKPWCWGRLPEGEFMSGTPRPLDGVGAFDELLLGSGFMCVRAGGEVSCMKEQFRRSPGEAGGWQKVAEFTDAVQIVGGSDHACVLRRAGQVACMGSLPYAFEVDRRHGWDAWTKIAELTDAVSLMPGRGDHACAMRRGGEVRCWGWGWSGQLGHGLFQPWRRPVAVIGVKGPRALVGGHGHACALTDTREVLCWGDNSAGQLGWEQADAIEVPELRKGKGDFDPIAMQLRESIRASATPVRALQLP